MVRHKVTRKTKSGKTITYWRGDGSKSSEKGSGKEWENKRLKTGKGGPNLGRGEY